MARGGPSDGKGDKTKSNGSGSNLGFVIAAHHAIEKPPLNRGNLQVRPQQLQILLFSMPEHRE